MPKLTSKVPAYSHHKQSNQARVFIDGRDILLGTFNSAASREKYNALIGEWLANGRQLPIAQEDVTVLHVIAGFLKHAKGYCRTPEGAEAGEVKLYKHALKPARELYGRSLATEFGPLALKAVREKMITPQTVIDPHIDALVQRALTSGYDAKIAGERVLESRAQNSVAAGRELPSVNAGGTYDYYRRLGPLGAVRPGDYQWFFYGFDSSWEIDLFGGVRRSVESSTATYAASIEASRGVRLTLAAEVVRNYIELRTAQRRLAIANDNLRYQEHTLAITRQRLAAGVVTDLDAFRAAALVAATRSAIPPLKSNEKRSIRSIGVLVGADPDALTKELEATAPIPAPPSRMAVGLPADLLRHRPDLRQAERLLAAASARIGVATADLYPHLTLVGNLGAHDVQTSDLFDWSRRHVGIGPSVSWNIFDAGRTRARIDAEKAATAAALASYEKTLLNAIAETENEMTDFNNERERAHSLEESVDANRKSVATGSQLYLQGVTDFITVLDAERSLAASEDALALSNEAIGVHAVSLCKALGGGWHVDESAR